MPVCVGSFDPEVAPATGIDMGLGPKAGVYQTEVRAVERPRPQLVGFAAVTKAASKQKEEKMISKLIVGAATAATLMSGIAFAQSSTVNGAAGGAITGAIVGGPVGAAVGGVAGAVVGTAIDPPPQKVITYVREAPAPSARVVVKEKIVVGQPLPETVVVTPIPDDPTYAYAVVNDERIIVEPSSRKVIQVIK